MKILLLEKQKKIEEATLIYDDIIKQRPDDYEAYKSKAELLKDLGKYDEAIETI